MKQVIITTNAPTPIGPYNQAILKGNTLYTSGQIAINPANGHLVLEDIKLETHQVMKNMAAVLNEAKMTFEDVVKATIFITDMNNFSAINVVYGSYFNEVLAPARETVQVSKLPKNVNVEISMIAIK